MEMKEKSETASLADANCQSWIWAITLFHAAHQSTSPHQINEHIYC